MYSSNVTSIFSQDFLNQLERLSLIANQLVNNRQRAERKASQRGVSPEFAEYRSYVPGDDSRFIDWNAFARWRRLIMKLFIEEYDLPVYMLIDCSGSMQWGEPNKFIHALQIAAGLTYISLSNHDQVGIYSLGKNTGNQVYPASRGKSHFWQVLKILADYKINEVPQSLEDDVRQWLTLNPKRGMVLWISDLWGADKKDVLNALDRLRYSRHEIAVIQIFDSSESETGGLGEFKMESIENHNNLSVLIDKKLQLEYEKIFLDYQNSILNYCRQYHISLLQIKTAVTVTDLLTTVLQQKGFIH